MLVPTLLFRLSCPATHAKLAPLVLQAVSLNCFPRVTIKHTSETFRGQVGASLRGKSHGTVCMHSKKT